MAVSIHRKVYLSHSRFIVGRFIAVSIHRGVDSSQGRFIAGLIHRGLIHRRVEGSIHRGSFFFFFFFFLRCSLKRNVYVIIDCPLIGTECDNYNDKKKKPSQEMNSEEKLILFLKTLLLTEKLTLNCKCINF
jgi:hypothetical protein